MPRTGKGIFRCITVRPLVRKMLNMKKGTKHQLGNKRKKALDLLDWLDIKPIAKEHYPALGLKKNMRNWKDGVSAEQAFFLKSETGKLPSKVQNVSRLAQLLSAQRWLAAQEKMWREGFLEGTTLMSDFDEEPEGIKELAHKAMMWAWNQQVGQFLNK